MDLGGQHHNGQQKDKANALMNSKIGYLWCILADKDISDKEHNILQYLILKGQHQSVLDVSFFWLPILGFQTEFSG